MKERVALLDGRLEVESSRESGTTVVAEVPLR
jgi:signal transduction histidine kinase